MPTTTAKPKLKRHPSVSAKTVRILQKVKDAILEEPRRLDMGDWGKIFDENVETFSPDDNDYIEQRVAPCRTAACLAGHALLLTKAGREFLKPYYAQAKALDFDGYGSVLHVRFPYSSEQKAADIMDLKEGQQRNLFYTDGWPGKFEDRYAMARTPRQKAKIAAARIDHFIQTGE